MGEKQAERVIEKGTKDSNLVRVQGEQILGKQQVGLAGQGVDLGSGSALDIQKETITMSSNDARTVQNNAYLDALGIKYQTQDMRNQGNMARIAGDSRAASSLVNAGLGSALTIQRYGTRNRG